MFVILDTIKNWTQGGGGTVLYTYTQTHTNIFLHYNHFLSCIDDALIFQ